MNFSFDLLVFYVLKVSGIDLVLFLFFFFMLLVTLIVVSCPLCLLSKLLYLVL